MTFKYYIKCQSLWNKKMYNNEWQIKISIKINGINK